MIRWLSRLSSSCDTADTTSADEARAALERAQQLTGDVAAVGGLAAELRDANHFSAMVRLAISQSRE